jgi:hypothetical protein
MINAILLKRILQVAFVANFVLPSLVFSNTCQSLLSSKSSGYDARLFLQNKVDSLLDKISENKVLIKDELFNKSPRVLATRKSFLEFLYSKNLAQANEGSFLLADKLIFTKLIKKLLGKKFLKYHVDGVGVKEFFLREDLIDLKGNFKTDKDLLRNKLKKSFPDGFVVKPLLVADSKGAGIYTNFNDFYNALFDSKSPILQSDDLKAPSKITSQWAGDSKVASGERYLIQAKIGVNKKTRQDSSEFREYRIHTYGRDVVKDATVYRWDGDSDSKELQRVEGLIADFLNDLPEEFSYKNGFSFDVFVNQFEVKIVEMNTNFGIETGWSGFTRDPRILGAYVRFFEKKYDWSFGDNIHARILRKNLGNMKLFVKKELKAALYKKSIGQEPALILDSLLENAQMYESYLSFVPVELKPYKASRILVSEMLSKIKLHSELRSAERGAQFYFEFFQWAESVE